MKAVAAAAAVSYAAGAVWHLARPTMPAYVQWGIDGYPCGGAGRIGDGLAQTDVQDPVSTLSSLTLFAAVIDTPAAFFGALLAAVSGLLHAYQRDCLSALDHAVAAAAPVVVALADVPIMGATALAVALWVQYDPNTKVAAVPVFAAGLLLAVGRLARRSPPVRTVIAIGVSLGTALAIKELNGSRVPHICANDANGAYADDARHSAWHVNSAIGMWAATKLIVGSDAGRHVLQFSLAGALPLAASLINFYTESAPVWAATTLLSAALMCWTAMLPPPSPVHAEATVVYIF